MAETLIAAAEWKKESSPKRKTGDGRFPIKKKKKKLATQLLLTTQTSDNNTDSGAITIIDW